MKTPFTPFTTNTLTGYYEQASMKTPFTTNTRMNKLQAIGHPNRKGHTLTGYYEPTETEGIVRLVRTCCPKEA